MNTFTFFALVICAIFAMVSTEPAQPADEVIAVDADPVADVLEGAESRGYGYNRRGGGGHYGHDHYHNHGHGHYGHGR